MRLIDADALVARLEDDARHMEMPIAQMYTYGAINDIKKEPTVAVIPQWIPVTDRPPEKEGHYFVTDEAAGMAETLIDKYICCDDGEWVWLYSQNVTAWMELPAPYKEGQDGGDK